LEGYSEIFHDKNHPGEPSTQRHLKLLKLLKELSFPDDQNSIKEPEAFDLVKAIVDPQDSLQTLENLVDVAKVI
jgi:hypothetical protein